MSCDLIGVVIIIAVTRYQMDFGGLVYFFLRGEGAGVGVGLWLCCDADVYVLCHCPKFIIYSQ
jgi:hypothetical protein